MIPGYSDDWVFEMREGKITRVGKGGTDTYNMEESRIGKRKMPC
mgnify:CR=1 FL=1